MIYSVFVAVNILYLLYVHIGNIIDTVYDHYQLFLAFS